MGKNRPDRDFDAKLVMTKNNQNQPELQGYVRSFGRTSSRMNQAEQAALDESLQTFAFIPQKASTAFEQTGALTVELGVGKGEQILARAAANPQERFVACEVFKNGLRFLRRQAQQKQLENLKIYPDDARQLMADLPAQSVDKLMVLYPDPWPKNKHKKRRLVNQSFLGEANRVLKDDGELLLVTDIVDYTLWMLHAVYQEGSFFPTATSPQAWATPPENWVPTGYERKAKKEGRSPFYLKFCKTSAAERQNHNKGETTEK